MNESETAFCPHCGHHLSISRPYQWVEYFCVECGVKVETWDVAQYAEVVDLRKAYDPAARAEAES